MLEFDKITVPDVPDVACTPHFPEGVSTDTVLEIWCLVGGECKGIPLALNLSLASPMMSSITFKVLVV